MLLTCLTFGLSMSANEGSLNFDIQDFSQDLVGNFLTAGGLLVFVVNCIQPSLT